MGSVTISDLKKHLGPGLGLRKNRYLIEIPLKDGTHKNILCMATSLPERSMSTTSAYFLGRKYNMRGETEYGGTFEVSFVDDSSMKLRQEFDAWMNAVDNSNFNNGSDSSNNGFIRTHNQFIGSYYTDINIWQLANDGVTAVYGYRLQNCFPSSVGTVTLEDTTENQLSEFSVVFTFSEFIPIKDGGKKDIGTGSSVQGLPGISSSSTKSSGISLSSIISSFNLFR
jgi:hypothetical protein